MGASGDIRVEAVGLAVLASRCTEHYAALGAATAPTVSGLGGQPSAAAVAAAHAVVDATGGKLAARLSDTATDATAGAQSYTSTDHTNGAQIAAVSDGLTEV